MIFRGKIQMGGSPMVSQTSGELTNIEKASQLFPSVIRLQQEKQFLTLGLVVAKAIQAVVQAIDHKEKEIVEAFPDRQDGIIIDNGSDIDLRDKVSQRMTVAQPHIVIHYTTKDQGVFLGIGINTGTLGKKGKMTGRHKHSLVDAAVNHQLTL